MTRRSTRIVVALIAFIIYLAIPTKNYYWDGVSFSEAIENAPHWNTLFHPNHLVYNVVGWAIYQFLGRSVRALYVLQTLNSLFAGLAVYVVSGILSRITGSRATTLLLTAAFAFSGTFWRFSTDADAYILSVLLLILCAQFLLLSERPSPLAVALVHTMAMLIHQLSVLFLPAPLYLLWKKQSPHAKHRILPLATCSGLAGGLTLSLYFAAFRLQTGRETFRAFGSWTASHADDVTFSFRILKNAGISIRSWVQLFLVGRPSMVNYTDPLTVVLLALLAMVLVFLIIGIVRRPATHTAISQDGNPTFDRVTALHFSLIWFATYAVFLLFWLPNNTFYKLFALPAIIFAIAAYWRPGAPLKLNSPIVLTVIAVALFNLTFAIIPYSHPNANEAVQFALELRKPLSTNADVYFKNLNTDDWFAQYFTPSAHWKVVESTTAIDANLRGGNKVWLETTAIDSLSKTDPAWFYRRVAGAQWRELVDGKHYIRFVELAPLPMR